MSYLRAKDRAKLPPRPVVTKAYLLTRHTPNAAAAAAAAAADDDDDDARAVASACNEGSHYLVHDTVT